MELELKKSFCLTLDLEADHGWKEQKKYDSLSMIKRLVFLLKQYEVPLTIFVTGKIIENQAFKTIERANNGANGKAGSGSTSAGSCAIWWPSSTSCMR